MRMRSPVRLEWLDLPVFMKKSGRVKLTRCLYSNIEICYKSELLLPVGLNAPFFTRE